MVAGVHARSCVSARTKVCASIARSYFARSMTLETSTGRRADSSWRIDASNHHGAVEAIRLGEPAQSGLVASRVIGVQERGLLRTVVQDVVPGHAVSHADRVQNVLHEQLAERMADARATTSERKENR